MCCFRSARRFCLLTSTNTLTNKLVCRVDYEVFWLDMAAVVTASPSCFLPERKHDAVRFRTALLLLEVEDFRLLTRLWHSGDGPRSIGHPLHTSALVY